MRYLPFSSWPRVPKCLKYQNVPKLRSFWAIWKPWEIFQSWDMRVYFIPVPNDHTVTWANTIKWDTPSESVKFWPENVPPCGLFWGPRQWVWSIKIYMIRPFWISYVLAGWKRCHLVAFVGVPDNGSGALKVPKKLLRIPVRFRRVHWQHSWSKKRGSSQQIWPSWIG